MPKGYWIVQVDIHNPEGYKAYIAANGPVFHKYGAKFLARGGPFETREGTLRSRKVLIEFKDYATALACYNSDEYQALVRIRTPHAQADLAIVEGYDGPQP